MGRQAQPSHTRGNKASPPADALARLALSTARAGGPELLAHLVQELAAALAMPLVFLAVPAHDARRSLRTLAITLDGHSQPNIHLPARALAGLPTFPAGYQFAAAGPLPLLPARSLFAREGMDAVAALPLAGSCGEALGLLVAMARQPLAPADALRIEAMLSVVAGRAAAEIERARTGETLRAVALAVSESRSGSAFDELVRLLATILQVDVAFIAQPEPGVPGAMRMLALFCAGKVLQDVRYPLAGSPCATVLGHSFRAYPSGVQALFPADADLRELGSESYAGHPLVGHDGTALGIVSVASRQPLTQLDRVKATLKIFAVRAAAEVERLRAGEAQKQAVEDLRQREAQYRAIFESTVDGLFLWDEDLKVVDVNPAALALYGYTREDLVGRSFPRTMPEDYVRERLQWVRRALAGEATHLETTVLRPNGSSFEADLRVLPFSHRGRPHALAVLRDIGERRQRERELRRSEEQYRAIFNASLDAMVLRAADFSIVDVNATYEAWTGRTRAEVLGVARVLANPPGVRERIRELHDEAIAGATIRLETQIFHRDGRRRELELRGVPISHRGQPHVLYLGRDITERVAAEQRRAELERQLRQAQKMEAIGQLTGGLAHDFNNLLTSVLGYLDMAQEHPAAAAAARLAHDLDQARLAAERAREHVAQLLAFSRPRRGERKLLAPAHVAAEVLQLLRPNLPSSIVVDSELPPEGALAPVLADPVQFEQVLLNLCLNARDAIGEQGAIRLRIFHAAAAGHCASCSARIEGGRWVAFEVGDDGRGMTPEVVDRMFEPFFTTKETGRGTGMGLAMVHGIVHDHGGHVLVTTAPGAGSAFRVLLPAAEEVEATAWPPAARAAAATLPPLRGRVLLVEDEPFVSRFMQDLMRSWGLEVVPESDALAAARRLDAPGEAFALLLTDHTMPGMTGLALARHAHRRRPGLPVLLYTGNALAITEQELAESGVTTLLRKPVDCYVLRPLLGELLSGRGPETPA